MPESVKAETKPSKEVKSGKEEEKTELVSFHFRPHYALLTMNLTETVLKYIITINDFQLILYIYLF